MPEGESQCGTTGLGGGSRAGESSAGEPDRVATIGDPGPPVGGQFLRVAPLPVRPRVFNEGLGGDRFATGSWSKSSEPFVDLPIRVT